MTALSWARCDVCKVDFDLCVTVPCPIDLYLAALRAARCPKCGNKGKNLSAYEPGRAPRLKTGDRLPGYFK